MAVKKSKTNFGIVSYFDTEEFIGQSALDYGCLWEESLTILATAPYLEKSKLILDLGAHVGCFTLLAKKFSQKCSVFCFEIQEKIHELLEENIAQNKLENVKTFKCAVGDSMRKITISNTIRDGENAGEIYAYDNGKKHNFGGVSLGEGTEEIDMITIDSLKLKECDFIKIDIEDYEFFAVCGSIKTLKKFKPVLFFEHTADTPIVKPNEYMLEVCSRESMDKFRFYGGNIFSLLASVGYNYFQKWGTNYCARCDEAFENMFMGHQDAYEVFCRMVNSNHSIEGWQKALKFVQAVHERRIA